MPSWRVVGLAMLLAVSAAEAGEVAAARSTATAALDVYTRDDGYLFCLRGRPGQPAADKALSVAALSPRGADPPRVLGQERASDARSLGLFLPIEAVSGHRRIRVSVDRCPAAGPCDAAAFDLPLPHLWPINGRERTCS